MQRLPSVDENSSPEISAVFAELALSRGKVSNALRSMGHAPEALRRFAAVGDYARYHSSLSGRVREIVIVVTGRNVPYALAYHVQLALQAGVTQAEVDDLKAGKVPGTFGAIDAAVTRYVLEFTSPQSVSDGTFQAISAVMSPREITDVTMMSAYYVALAMTITALRVPLDPHDRLVAEREWQNKRDLEKSAAARQDQRS